VATKYKKGLSILVILNGQCFNPFGNETD